MIVNVYQIKRFEFCAQWPTYVLLLYIIFKIVLVYWLTYENVYSFYFLTLLITIILCLVYVSVAQRKARMIQINMLICIRKTLILSQYANVFRMMFHYCTLRQL